jgi:hypothetical protein
MESDQSAQYKKYQKRALWYPATQRTAIGLQGAIYRKPLTYEGMEGERWEALRENITGSGMSLDSLLRMLSLRVMVQGRYGLLVDLREGRQDWPKMCGYTASQIRFWETREVLGEERLSLLVLYETTVTPDPSQPDDPFARAVIPQFRVLTLDETDRYAVDIWREIEVHGQKEWRPIEGLHREPLRRGERLPFIPFCFFNPADTDMDPDVSPLLGVVDTNIDHYRLDADLKNALHMVGVPTPVLVGFNFGATSSEENDSTTDDVPVGPDYALTSENDRAQWGYLEYEGRGLDFLTSEKEADEKRMAVMGARLLEQPATQGEAAMTVRFRHSGEHATLAGMAGTLEDGINQALWWVAEWALLPSKEVRVTYNKDYFGGKMDAPMITALVQALQAGAMDYDTLFYNLEQGELTIPGETAEDVRQRIEIQQPVMDLEPDAELE